MVNKNGLGSAWPKNLDNSVLRILARAYDRVLFHERFGLAGVSSRISFMGIDAEVLNTSPFSSMNKEARDTLTDLNYRNSKQSRFGSAMDIALLTRRYGLSASHRTDGFPMSLSDVVDIDFSDSFNVEGEEVTPELLVTPYGLFFAVSPQVYHTIFTQGNEIFVPLPAKRVKVDNPLLSRVGYVISYGYDFGQRFQTAQFVGSLIHPTVRTPVISPDILHELSTFSKYVANEVLASERRIFDVLVATTLAYGTCNMPDLFAGLNYKADSYVGSSTTPREYFESVITTATEYYSRLTFNADLDKAGFENIDAYVADVCLIIPKVLKTIQELGQKRKYSRKLIGTVMLDAKRIRDLAIDDNGQQSNSYRTMPLARNVTKLDELLKSMVDVDDPVYQKLFTHLYSATSLF